MSKYHVVEVFKTLQGEGFHAGTSAVFVRFAGCNLWSGYDEHRQRDAARHGAECPRWCDTDFRKGTVMDEAQLEVRMREVAGLGAGVVVFTGGEPLLQLDTAAVRAARRAVPYATIALETNGTHVLPEGLWIDWVCLSPKVAPEHMVLTEADELKVVVPDYDPLAYERVIRGRRGRLHLFVQPRAATSGVGVSLLDKDVMARAARFCMENPTWRLSTQTHKVIGLP